MGWLELQSDIVFELTAQVISVERQLFEGDFCHCCESHAGECKCIERLNALEKRVLEYRSGN